MAAYKIRYSVDVEIFTDDGSSVFTPARVKGFIKEVDYSRSFTPKMIMTIMVGSSHVNIIKNNQRRLLTKITMNRLKYTNSSDMKERNEVETSLVFSQVFVPIVEPDDITDFREHEYIDPKGSIDDKTTSGQDRSMNLYEIRLSLTTLDYNLMYKKSYNLVIRGEDNNKITVDSAIRYICETCGVAGFIMDMPDNIVPIDNIMIPPGNVKFCLDMLQTVYGIYYKSLTSFFDFDGILYVLSRLSTEHDYAAGMPRMMHLLIKADAGGGSDSGGSTEYMDEQNVRMSVFKGLTDSTSAISSGEADGDSIVFTNFAFSTGTIKTDDNGKQNASDIPTREFLRKTLSHESTGKGMSFEYDELNNPFNLFSTLEGLGIKNTYMVRTEGMDIDCLKPNVLFTIQIDSRNPEDNDRYNGKKFPILGYIQEYIRDNDVTSDNVFRSYERIMLADLPA